MATRKAPAKVRGVFEREPGSGVWWICYKQGTVRKREMVGRRGDAIELYRQRKTELRAGAKLAPNLRTKGVTFGVLAAEALKWSAEFHPKDIRTVTGRMAKLTGAFGPMAASELTPQMIDTWLTEYRTKGGKALAPATKNRFRALISLVYRQGMRHGKVKVNPARLVAARAENNARVRYLLPDEEKALRKAMEDGRACYLPALDVSLNTGMRLSEQFSLTWEAIDFERREIVLEETKNGSSRRIPINSVCEAALRSLVTEGQKPTDRVFSSRHGKAINTPRKWFEASLADAKIEGVTWHTLRHTFCSRLAMAGIDIRMIAELAGHKTLAMAMRYSHLAPSSKLSAIEKLAAVSTT